jgi:hypothetical protein
MDAQVFIRGDFAMLLSLPASRIAGVSFLLIVYGIVAAVINGWQCKLSLWIPALAIAAFVGAWSFTGAVNREVAEGRKVVSWGPSFSAMVGFLPNLIGCFVFYEGIGGILSNRERFD